MATVTLSGFVPPPRYDTPVPLPYTRARIEAASVLDPLTFTVRGSVIELADTPEGIDLDPTRPISRSFTSEDALPTDMWWRVVFIDADGDETPPSDPIKLVPWAPSVQDIANRKPEYTRRPVTSGGGQLNVFDETTRPTATEVQGFINDAVSEIQSRVGVELRLDEYDLAKTTAEWYASMMIESKFGRTDLDDATSALRFAERQYVGNLNELIAQSRYEALRLT